VAARNASKTLVNIALSAATTHVSDAVAVPEAGSVLSIESVFVRAAGGTTTKVYIQTSLDGGTTWFDVAQHDFATTTASKLSAVNRCIAPATQAVAPGDGALTADTIVQGILGDRVRAKVAVVGTYTGASSLKVVAVFN
jgi:hypothetical protein